MTGNPLVGRWRLVSWENRNADGQVSFPFGEQAQGYIQYDADGFMFVSIMHQERPALTDADPFAGTLAEKGRVSETYISYCGSYEFRGESVIHRVELSLYPGWVGGEQTRLVELIEPRLILSTPLRLIGGQELSAHLTWERVGSVST